MVPSNKRHTLKNPALTARQGQFLAYIYQYSLVNGCAPAEADMERYFQTETLTLFRAQR